MKTGKEWTYRQSPNLNLVPSVSHLKMRDPGNEVALTFSSLNMQIIFLLLIISDQVIANHLKRFLTILCNQSSNCTLSFPGIGKNLIKRGFSAFNLVYLNCELDSGSENKKLLTNSYLAMFHHALWFVSKQNLSISMRHVPDHLFLLSYRKLKYAR